MTCAAPGMSALTRASVVLPFSATAMGMVRPPASAVQVPVWTSQRSTVPPRPGVPSSSGKEAALVELDDVELPAPGEGQVDDRGQAVGDNRTARVTAALCMARTRSIRQILDWPGPAGKPFSSPTSRRHPADRDARGDRLGREHVRQAADEGEVRWRVGAAGRDP